jgi:hypothetical protein
MLTVITYLQGILNAITSFKKMAFQTALSDNVLKETP